MDKVSLALRAGRNLKVIIKELGYTQKQAAELLHIEERTLRRYLQKGIESVTVIENVLRVFSIGLEDIFK